MSALIAMGVEVRSQAPPLLYATKSRIGHVIGTIAMNEESKGGKDDVALQQVEFDINDVNSEDARRAVCDAVNGLNGVRDVQFVAGGAIVTFNPLGITKEEICTAVRRSGHRATEITTGCGTG